MADYTKLNLKQDVEDMAPRFGYFRLPFGHQHGEQEEVYVVLSGSLRVKAGEDVVELAELDAIRVPGATPRC